MKEMQKYSIDFIENVDSLDQNELESLKGGVDFCDCFCLINFASNEQKVPGEEPDEN